MDAFAGKVAICPITDEMDFKGQEYLSLYPVLGHGGEMDLASILSPNESESMYLKEWLK